MMNDGEDDDGAFRVDRSSILILIESCFDAGWYGVKFWGRVRGGIVCAGWAWQAFLLWVCRSLCRWPGPDAIVAG